MTHPSAVRNAAARAGSAACDREAKKNAKCAALANQKKAIFSPFFLETYGHWGVQAVRLIKKIARHAEATTGAS